jgi:TRAP-type C4-dicarboxylate transport system permease small subunit
MVALSTVLPARICRVANIVLGAFYTLVMLAVIPGTWYFFKMFAVIEICLSLSIAWLAFAWPKSKGPATNAA